MLGTKDIASFDKHWWREQIALVSQEIYLFAGTIRDNITYGKLGATQASIELAAEQAGILSFIQGLPDGYETRVGERGLTLSGGERQRLAIARALLKDAPILILDEATSAVDNETERLIQEALLSVARQKTTIMIAHPLRAMEGPNGPMASSPR